MDDFYTVSNIYTFATSTFSITVMLTRDFEKTLKYGSRMSGSKKGFIETSC